MIKLDGGAVLAVGFGAETPGLAGIETNVAHEVRSGLGDVLGELGDEVQRVEDLEVAGVSVRAATTTCAESPRRQHFR